MVYGPLSIVHLSFSFLSCQCFLFNNLFKNLHIIPRMLVNEPLDLLAGELGELGVHFKVLDPDHLNSFRAFDVEPDDFHVNKREHRLMARGKGEFLVLVKPALGNPGLAVLVSQTERDLVALALQDLRLGVFLAKKLRPAFDLVGNVEDQIIRCANYDLISSMSHLLTPFSRTPASTLRVLNGGINSHLQLTFACAP